MNQILVGSMIPLIGLMENIATNIQMFSWKKRKKN